MKRIFFFFFIINTITSAAQTNKELDSMRISIHRQMIESESLRIKSDSLLRCKISHDDSVNRVMDMEQNSRNLNSLLSSMKEREQKQRRNLWLRIGLGILFLVIGIIGATRKRKAKNNTTT